MEVQGFAVGAQGDGDGQQQTDTNMMGYEGSRRYLKTVQNKWLCASYLNIPWGFKIICRVNTRGNNTELPKREAVDIQ